MRAFGRILHFPAWDPPAPVAPAARGFGPSQPYLRPATRATTRRPLIGHGPPTRANWPTIGSRAFSIATQSTIGWPHPSVATRLSGRHRDQRGRMQTSTCPRQPPAPPLLSLWGSDDVTSSTARKATRGGEELQGPESALKDKCRSVSGTRKGRCTR